MMRFIPVFFALSLAASPALAGVPDAFTTLEGPIDATFVSAQPVPADWQELRAQDPVRAAAWQTWIAAPELAREASEATIVSTRAGGLRLVGGPESARVAPVHLDVALHGTASESERVAHARAGVALTDDLELVDAFLTDASPGLRGVALSALARHPDARAGELVAAALDDADPTVREIAASVLGRRADAKAHGAALAAAAVDGSPAVRRLAVRALGWHTLTAHQSVVAGRLTDRDAQVRLAALRALERLDAAAAVRAARGMTEDADEAVRRAAQGLLTP